MTSKQTRKKFGKQLSFDWSRWDIESDRVLRNGKFEGKERWQARKEIIFVCFARSFATVCKAGGAIRFYHLARLFGPWHEKEEKGMDVHMLTHFYENRFSRDRPRFTDNLDVIKFLCKDLWTILFRKQIDNLKTNHRVCANSSSRIRNSP